jgi:hypothetical protein
MISFSYVNEWKSSGCEKRLLSRRTTNFEDGWPREGDRRCSHVATALFPPNTSVACAPQLPRQGLCTARRSRAPESWLCGKAAGPSTPLVNARKIWLADSSHLFPRRFVPPPLDKIARSNFEHRTTTFARWPQWVEHMDERNNCVEQGRLRIRKRGHIDFAACASSTTRLSTWVQGTQESRADRATWLLSLSVSVGL